MLGLLEDAGLVDRAADPSDRRSCLLSISPAGAELLAAVRIAQGRLHRRSASTRWTAEDRAALDRAAGILERLLEEGGE